MKGTLLPIHSSFYGEIEPSELQDFINTVSAALSFTGFRYGKTISESTQDEQQLWVLGDGYLTVEGNPATVVDRFGDDMDLSLDFTALVGCNVAEIIELLKECTSETD